MTGRTGKAAGNEHDMMDLKNRKRGGGKKEEEFVRDECEGSAVTL